MTGPGEPGMKGARSGRHSARHNLGYLADRLIRGEGQVAKASRNRATARAKSPSGPWWHSVNGVVTGWPESEAQRSRSSQLLASRWRSPGTAGGRAAPPGAPPPPRRARTGEPVRNVSLEANPDDLGRAATISVGVR